MTTGRKRCLSLVIAAIGTFSGCDSLQAERRSIPVFVDALPASEPFLSDLGYEIQIQRCQMQIEQLVFYRASADAAFVDVRSGFLPGSSELLEHPGHAHSGEAIGELAEKRSFDCVQNHGMLLGDATFAASTISGARFLLAPEVESGEAALVLEGIARRDGQERAFRVDVSFLPDSRVDAVAVLGESSEYPASLHFTVAFTGEQSVMDGIDWFSLQPEQSVVVADKDSDAAFRVARAMVNHEHYWISRDSNVGERK